ncbi:MAG: FHA domain-containing protein [Woeseiaceae bacterium]|nr:FHA domain-containing protein [Woeseiaceae bacterium]
MDLAAAGLREQPFPTHGKPLAVVSYASHADALGVLKKTCESPKGLALLQGPPLSGKSTLIRQFVDSIPEECSVAVVDGAGKNTSALLEALMRGFGYHLDFNSTGELLAMARVFALQQASSHEPPIVIIENADALNPSALRALTELAELRVREIYALKIVLVSDHSMRELVDSTSMRPIARRVTADFHLHPMTSTEAVAYLHEKLRIAGSDKPEFVFPISVCNELWEASGGWPGILDRLALLAIARTKTLPVAASIIEHPEVPAGTWHGADEQSERLAKHAEPEPPTLYVTLNGKTLKKLTFDKPRMLVGRSEHNDLAIDSRFVSRHHLLLVRHGGSTFLMDLNSTNGTFVNSKRVSNHILIDDDVITVGHHRVKYYDPHAKRRAKLEGTEFSDTAIMKTLADMRSLLADENTAELPAPSENLPTLGN